MTITPDLIPHTDFHTGIWLQSTARPAQLCDSKQLHPAGPSWYYFKRKINHNRISNENFIDSVDEPLKELVLFLHSNGIKTTPSCAGHHKSERNFEKIYEELEEDRCLIRSCGLNLKDIETDQICFYKNKKYELPWKKQEFIEKLMIYQEKGVLGLRLGNRKRIRTQLLKMEIENARVVEKDRILFFLTGEHGETDIKATWREITEQVKLVFEYI